MKKALCENQQYFHNFFSGEMNILDCKFKVPRKNSWNGHPYYFELLKSLEKVAFSLPTTLVNICSIPVWFNRALNTKFDIDLSKAGFNYIKDFFPECQLINLHQNRPPHISPNKMRKLRGILTRIPEPWLNCIESSVVTNTVINPRQVVNIGDSDRFIQNCGSDIIYKILISKLIRLPTGVLRWREIIDLSDQQLKTALSFAKLCSKSVFDQVFQYKIVVQILPTGKYLYRYQIRDSEECSRCLQSADTVLHSTWHCSRLSPYLTTCLEYLQAECNVVVDITLEKYLFGFGSSEHCALNHILLELKKHIFYNWSEDIGVEAFCEQFIKTIKSIIIKEKTIAVYSDTYSTFDEKWKLFTSIYDYRGPDNPLIYS